MDSPFPNTNLTTKKLSKSFLVDSIINGNKNSSKSSVPYDQLMTPYYSNLGNYLYTLGFSAPRFPTTSYLPIPNFGIPQNANATFDPIYSIGGGLLTRNHTSSRTSEKSKPIKPIPTTRIQRDIKTTCKEERKNEDEKNFFYCGMYNVKDNNNKNKI